MPKPPPNLSPLEWEIMNIIWEFNTPPSVRHVLEKAYPKKEKAYTTVQTVMNNLEKKGYLSKEKIGLVNFYKPLYGKQKLLKQVTGGFMQKAFNGSFLSMASFLMEGDELSQEDIEGLKQLIKQKEQNNDQ